MLNDITTPTLLIDKGKCLTNVKQMVNKAKANGIPLRPHFKTHQSHQVGRWFRECGVDRIAVSSIKMASYFADDNWRDITVAFPTNLREIERINQLASRPLTLNLLVENKETVEALHSQLNHSVNLLIKADIGYHRTGLSADQFQEIDELIHLIGQSPKLHFKGFLAHAGHSYTARSQAQIQAIHNRSLENFLPFKRKYQAQFPDLILSYGDTPTCSTIDDFSRFDEIRPGNFVFYDLAQYRIGSCSIDQIAVAMACPVVAKHASRQEIVVYGGGVHFSKDRSTLPNGETYYGLIVEMHDSSWQVPASPSYVTSLSQEHGIIRASPTLFQQAEIGDLIYILPVHSCMAANAMKEYRSLDGEIISMMR